MTKPALRPAVLIIAAVAVTATATALITASLVADDSVLTSDDVDRALAGATGTPTGNVTGTATGQPTTTTTATTTGSAGDVVSTLTPGIVTLHCSGTEITLVSWSPNPGWRADDPVRGPAGEVSVRFESDVAEDYKVTATCVNGVPVAQLGPDDHSGRGSDD